jgi:hypothetical protein
MYTIGVIGLCLIFLRLKLRIRKNVSSQRSSRSFVLEITLILK